jgi:hypothetical protein
LTKRLPQGLFGGFVVEVTDVQFVGTHEKDPPRLPNGGVGYIFPHKIAKIKAESQFLVNLNDRDRLDPKGQYSRV